MMLMFVDVTRSSAEISKILQRKYHFESVSCFYNVRIITCLDLLWYPEWTVDSHGFTFNFIILGHFPDSKVHGANIWGPSGADRTQMGPMLAPWTLLCGLVNVDIRIFILGISVCVYLYPLIAFVLNIEFVMNIWLFYIWCIYRIWAAISFIVCWAGLINYVHCYDHTVSIMRGYLI